MTTEVELLPLYAELQGHPKIEIIKHYARANIARATAPLQAEIEALRAEVAEWKRVAAAQAGLHDEAEARAKRLEKMLSAYQAAVNKIDDLIEYSLPMPSETKAALYAVLAILTTTLAKEITND
jgi:flagellar biosynthesis/type III secretory pathway protein FliH